MTARDIGFITKQIAGHGRRDASAPAEWTALMLAARSVGEDEFCEAVASRTRQNAAGGARGSDMIGGVGVVE